MEPVKPLDLLRLQDPAGAPPTRVARTSAVALELLARQLGAATVATVPDGLDAEVYVLLAVAASLGAGPAADVADALRSDPVSASAALAVLDAALGGARVVVEGSEKLSHGIPGELADMLAPRRSEVADWLTRVGAVSVVEPTPSVARLRLEPVPVEGWEAAALWQSVDGDAERYVLAVAAQQWLGELPAEDRRDAASLVLDLWQAISLDLRNVLALLVVHGRPIPHALAAATGLFDGRVLDLALRGGLVERAAGALRLSPAWYVHAPVHAGVRAAIHRRLADALAEVTRGGVAAHAGLAALEAHRHYVAQPDLERAREFARYGAVYLLDHARRESEQGRYALAGREYDAVLRLDDDARGTGTSALGARARAYAMHYRHWNRAQDRAEEMNATLAGYEAALVLWPDHALFWSRVVRCKFLLGAWEDALRALRDAYERVPPHPRRDAILLVRSSEQLLERGEVVPALLVATERRMTSTPFALAQLWDRVDKGEPVARLWSPGGAEVRLAAPAPMTVRRVSNDGAWEACWMGSKARAVSARVALRDLAGLVLTDATREVESDGPPPDSGTAAKLDLRWAARAAEPARWIAALQLLAARMAAGEVTPEQRAATLRLWRMARSLMPRLRRPALGLTGEGDYYLSWAYEGSSAVLTIDVGPDGTCWYWSRDAEQRVISGEGTVDTAIATLGSRLEAFVR